MIDTPKAIHFVALDHTGAALHYADRRGLDARWLAARHAAAAGVDMLRPRFADLVSIMNACAEAGAAIGLRVRLDDSELQRLRERARP